MARAIYNKKRKFKSARTHEGGLFPKEQTEKEKALLKNKTILSGLAPNFKRGKAIFERNTLKIVEMDVLGNELFHLGARGKAGAVQTFRFQCTEEIFHRRVIVQQHGL